nr:ATP-binding protein [Ectothiorhodospira mobilis]
MNAILGFAQLLEADPALAPPQQENVREILKGGRHLLHLINEVLDLSQVENGHLQLSLETVPVACVVEECFDLVQPLAEEAGITLEPGDAGDHHVCADRGRLRQVLIHLLANAIQYNRPGGRVVLGYAEDTATGRLRIQVRDSGYGIPPSRQAALFQPFTRLLVNDRMEGTGIGLSLSRRLVEAMNGAIGVESVEGAGSTFWIDLPRVPAPGAGETGDASSPDGGGEKGPSGETDRPVLTVLCVDDNPANLRLVEQILARRAVRVRLLSASTPGIGLELARVHHPDLILMDIHMPHMDGFQALQRLQDCPQTAGIPVVALTAHASRGDLKRMRDAGFTDHLGKPLEVDRFLQRLDRWLQGDGSQGF